MCLRLENNLVKREIADTDMIVYKYMYERLSKGKTVYRTPFMEFEMKFNKIYTSRLRKYNCQVEDGLHSLQDLVICEEEAHDDQNSWGDTVLVRCTIPKGAHFYRGRYGKSVSFASSRIVLNEIVKTI